jgi:hypothetical protein
LLFSIINEKSGDLSINDLNHLQKVQELRIQSLEQRD